MVSMTGRVIEQGVGKLMNSGIQGEIIYSFVIILCSLMIFFGTKELYQLSSQKGIKYFRLSFLFFALAYFSRSFIKIALFYFEKDELRNIFPTFGSITIFIFIYFSSMAIFYLLYSVMWKKWKSKLILYLFHLTALILATATSFFGSQIIYFFINILLFIFILATVFISRKQSKNKSNNLYTIYLLLFVFWILNILDVLISNFLKTTQLFIYLISLGIFLLILYKVIKKIG